MPVPAIVPLVSLAFGGFNVGASSYNLMKAQPDQFRGIELQLKEVSTALSNTQRQLIDMEIIQGLKSHVDHILGFFDSYKDNIVPTINALKPSLPSSDEDALDKLGEVFRGASNFKSWCDEVHHASLGASANLLAMHNQMMGSEVHGRGAIEAAFARSLMKVYGVATREELGRKFDGEGVKAGAGRMADSMNSFMTYVLRIEQIALGCLMSANLLDPAFHRPELIKRQKRTVFGHVDEQFNAAQNLIGLWGLLDGSGAYHELQVDCSV